MSVRTTTEDIDETVLLNHQVAPIKGQTAEREEGTESIIAMRMIKEESCIESLLDTGRTPETELRDIPEAEAIVAIMSTTVDY